MSEFVRILPDPSEARATHADKKNRGWRLRLIRKDQENADLFEEQVSFPERVHRADANNFREQRSIYLTPHEQRWLRDALSEMLGEPYDVEAWRDEIGAARAQEVSPAMERRKVAYELRTQLIDAADAAVDTMGRAAAAPHILAASLAVCFMAVLDGETLPTCSCGHAPWLHAMRGVDGKSMLRCHECRCTLSVERILELGAARKASKP